MGWNNNTSIEEDNTQTVLQPASESNTNTQSTAATETSNDPQEMDNSTFEALIDAAAGRSDKVLEEKEDATQEEVSKENEHLKAKLNWTDPIVWHDPTFDNGIIIKPVEADKGEKNSTDSPQTSHKIDAVYFPLIKINQRIIANNDILYMKLSSDGIVPELILGIRDANDTIKNTNSAGINSEITLVITAPVNGVYKKIKLKFYIDNVYNSMNPDGTNRLSFYCKLKLPELFQKQSTSMGYPDDYQWGGCDKCKQEKAEKPA